MHALNIRGIGFGVHGHVQAGGRAGYWPGSAVGRRASTLYPEVGDGRQVP
jgi:hypothetical protein